MLSRKFFLAIVVLLVLATGVLGASRSCTAGEIFYVLAGEAYLRTCPSPDCGVVTRLYRSEQVEYLDTNSYGWWQVRSLRTGAVGWVTADILSAVPKSPPPPAPPSPGYFYVATSNVTLRTYPLHSSGATGSVQLNDRVEKLGDSPQGWTKVRSLRDGSEGWMLTRYLSPSPAAHSRPAYAPKKRVKRSAPAAEKESEEKEEKAPATQEKAKPM